MIKLILILLGAAMVFGCPVRAPRAPRVRLGPTIDVGPKIGVGSGEDAAQYRRQYAYQISQLMYSYKFAPAGFWHWQKDFQPGEWTKWEVYSDGELEMETEVAYLGSFAQDRKWWRLAYNPREEDQVLFEALLDHEKFSLRRLRARFKDGEAEEIPVTEKDKTLVRPQKLTAESIEGATVGEENITLPAGSFNATLIRFGVSEGSVLRVWKEDTVPGGVVKYSISDNGEELEFRLKDYGTGARSKLDSF